MAGFGEAINWYHNNGLLPGIWKGMTGQLSNEVQNEQNLNYQRERNAIEDARYSEETAYNRAFAEDDRAYNRAFAEDERAYNRAFAEEERQYNRDFAENQRDYERALQQQIFEREDTAIERQANQLSKIGINPLSQNMDGLGSGSVVSSSGAGSSPAPSNVSPSNSPLPSASSRGGQALQSALTGVNNLTPALSLINSIDNLQTAGFQRDKLRAEVDGQQLANQEKAIMNENLKYRLALQSGQLAEDLRHSKENNKSVEKNTKASAERNQRENIFQETYGTTDNSDKFNKFSADTAHQADRFLQGLSDLGKKGEEKTQEMITQISKGASATGNKLNKLRQDATKTIMINGKKALDNYNRAMNFVQDKIVDTGKKGWNWATSKFRK